MPVAPLSDRAVLELAGADARSFLNGLVTQEISTLAAGQACYAGLLSPQGKALFDMFVVGAAEGSLLLDVAAARAADLLKRLTMYRLRAQVTIQRREDLAVQAGWGDAAMPEGAWPDPRHAAMGWRIMQHNQTQSPDLVEGSTDDASRLSDYHTHRISHGIPDTADIGIDQLLWLEANGDLLNGVSFTKGCYVGQENTARMHHRGKVRKRILHVTSAKELPSTGTVIFAGEKEAGHLLSVMGDQGLALLRLEFVENGAELLAGGVQVDMPLHHAAHGPPPRD